MEKTLPLFLKETHIHAFFLFYFHFFNDTQSMQVINFFTFSKCLHLSYCEFCTVQHSVLDV